jgi:hypothetical protein
MVSNNHSVLTKKALRDLGIDSSFRPEGTTLRFRQQVQRDTGGRRWRWSMDTLVGQHYVLPRLISLN